jgi:maltose alpha-D-glucosyltransferase/alpha-amylase
MSNPAVREEIQRIMGFWTQLGVSGFRVDAAPFLIEDLGLPDGQRDPFVHIREMHDFLTWRRGDAVLLAEANVPMDVLGDYFGDGDRMHLLYNFPVNRSLFAALAQGRATPLIEALRALPRIPEIGQWAIFLRNADEIDLSGLSKEDMEAVYAACGPEPDMQLYDRGIRRRLAPMLRGNPRKIALAFSLLFSLPGTPVVYYGDEIGMGDDLSLPERNSVRTPMQWSDEPNGGFSTAPRRRLIRPVVERGAYGYSAVNVLASQRDPDSILNHVERLIRTYKQLPALGRGYWSVLDTDQPSVLAHRSDWRGESVLVLHNLAEQPCEVRLKGRVCPSELREVLSDGSGYRPATDAGQSILLEGHGFRWFRLDGDRRTAGGSGF